MSVCTLAQVKAQLNIGLADTDPDAVLNQLIAGVSGAMARACGRLCSGAASLEKAARTLLITVDEPRTHVLWLPAWPVVSVSEVKEAIYGGHADVTALVADEAYQLRSDIGGLYRIGFWLSGVNTVKVTWIGGYVAAGGTPGAGETAMPSDLVDAAIRQVIHEFNQRAKPGVRGEGVQGANVTFYSDDKLLPGVRNVCAGYRRMTG